MGKRPMAIGLGMVAGAIGLVVLILYATGTRPLALRLGLILAVMVSIPLVFCILAGRLGSWFKANEGTGKIERLRDSFTNPWIRVGMAMLAFPLGVGWMVGFTGLFRGQQGSLLVGVISNAHMGLMFTGMAMVGLAFVHRGDDPRCRKCQYDLAGAPEGGYDTCPECGIGLRSANAIAKGTRRVIVPMVVAGAVLAVGSIATIGTLSHGSAVYMPYLPTASLIKEVSAAPRGFTHSEWAELLTRQLSPQQSEQLFGGMLDLRERKGFTSREAEGWMDQAALARSVPADMIERYYDGMLTLWIAAPDTVSRSQNPTFRFGLGGDFRGNIHVPASSVLQVWFVPEDLFAGDRPADMVHEPAGPIYGIQLGTADRSFRGVKRDPVNPASEGPVAGVDATLVPQDTLDLRGTGWLYIAPHGTPPPLAGASLPIGAVWSKRIDLRKTVRIEP